MERKCFKSREMAKAVPSVHCRASKNPTDEGTKGKKRRQVTQKVRSLAETPPQPLVFFFSDKRERLRKRWEKHWELTLKKPKRRREERAPKTLVTTLDIMVT